MYQQNWARFSDIGSDTFAIFAQNFASEKEQACKIHGNPVFGQE